MKEERELIVITCGSMAGGGAEPLAAAHLSPAATTATHAHQPLPTTPFPFSFSVGSTRWSSGPSLHIWSLFLRFLALLFSFTSALSLAAPSTKRANGKGASSFSDYPELLYSFIVGILASLYSAFQLFKGVWDIAYRGILLSDKTSDYISFVLDQLAGYTLMSSSSITMLSIQFQQRRETEALQKAAIVSVIMSFAAFLVLAACALFSGYKLCKRIMW